MMRTYASIVCGVMLFAVAADAAIVYAPNGLPRPYPFDGPDQLVMFDSDDPTGYTVVGSMGVDDIGFGGMDFDADGNLWAYASTYKSTGGAASGLYSVNIETGQATVQGTLSTQAMDDLAFNPVDGKMYGIRSQFTATRLFSIDLETGATTYEGTFSGIESSIHQVVGLAIDSQGNLFVHDVGMDTIYKSGSDLNLSAFYDVFQDTSYSQGMGIDWSGDDTGYHAAVGRGEYPNYFCTLNTFASDGSSYVNGPEFGPNEMVGGYGYPVLQPGDLAVMPVPEPTSVLLLVLGAACCCRRR
jgi:hypothetical protein